MNLHNDDACQFLYGTDFDIDMRGWANVNGYDDHVEKWIELKFVIHNNMPTIEYIYKLIYPSP
jgi:hypothetical protein